jgi:hypothetical protein
MNDKELSNAIDQAIAEGDLSIPLEFLLMLCKERIETGDGQ